LIIPIQGAGLWKFGRPGDRYLVRKPGKTEAGLYSEISFEENFGPFKRGIKVLSDDEEQRIERETRYALNPAIVFFSEHSHWDREFSFTDGTYMVLNDSLYYLIKEKEVWRFAVKISQGKFNSFSLWVRVPEEKRGVYYGGDAVQYTSMDYDPVTGEFLGGVLFDEKQVSDYLARMDESIFLSDGTELYGLPEGSYLLEKGPLHWTVRTPSEIPRAARRAAEGQREQNPFGGRFFVVIRPDMESCPLACSSVRFEPDYGDCLDYVLYEGPGGE
jgi:hypothetical protein